MLLRALIENTSTTSDYKCEHGLSLYIETQKHKILFDTGASGLFAENASVMGIDLSKVNIAVISHGHHDHGGGLKTFLGINSQAKVYIHGKAFEKHYGNRPSGVIEDIGLDAVGKYLLDTNSMCFACHCTGIESYERLKSIMGDRVEYLSTGEKITI